MPGLFTGCSAVFLVDFFFFFFFFFLVHSGGMIFHENCLLAGNSHIISNLIFVENWERCPKICHLLQFRLAL